jgi:hypothetical protein
METNTNPTNTNTEIDAVRAQIDWLSQAPKADEAVKALARLGDVTMSSSSFDLDAIGEFHRRTEIARRWSVLAGDLHAVTDDEVADTVAEHLARLQRELVRAASRATGNSSGAGHRFHEALATEALADVIDTLTSLARQL